MKQVLLKYTPIITLSGFIAWYIRTYSPFGISNQLPIIPAKVDGFILVSTFIAVFIFSQKELLRKNPDYKLSKLGLSGVIMVAISEFIFQTFRQFTYSDDIPQKISDFLHGVIGVPLLAGVISFLVAFQLKTKKTRLLLIFILTYCVICDVLLRMFPNL